MKFDIGNFFITDFCKENSLHCKFRRQIANDEAFLKFGFYHISDQLIEASDKIQLIPNNSYIIENKQGDLIGYLRLGDLNFVGTIKMEYGIHRDFRGEGYAYPLLGEITEYILKNMKGVKQIRGDISIDNRKSIIVAEKVGYVNCGRNDHNLDYRYTSNNKTK